MQNHAVKQISIFSENKPGRLAAIAEALEEEEVNIFAFSIAEAEGFGVIRAIVDKPEAAHHKLGELGFTVSYTDVIAVQMRDEPGGLKEIAKVLGDNKINIEYAYAYHGKDSAVLILRVDYTEKAIDDLLSRGCKLIEDSHFH